MKSTESNQRNELSPGGMLKGYGFGIVLAIIVFAISENFVIALASYVALGTTLGLVFSQKEHAYKEVISEKYKLTAAVLVVIGVVILLIFLLV